MCADVIGPHLESPSHTHTHHFIMSSSKSKTEKKNFTVDESLYLVDLIADSNNKPAITSKARDSAAITEKDDAWARVHTSWIGLEASV